MSRDQGAFELGIAVLIVVFVAAFVFLPFPEYEYVEAMGGSTSTPCDCSQLDNCPTWTAAEDPHWGCKGTQWEDCSQVKKGNTVMCNTAEKKLPRSEFIYENAAPWCQNTDDTDSARVNWTRKVSAVGNGGVGNKTVKFTPKITITFPGFTDANTCPVSAGEIDIDSFLFASMNVCGSVETDPTKSYSTGSEGYGTGWSHVAHIFKKVGGTWKFSGGATSPHSETFTIEGSCACSAETVDQKISVETQVINNVLGVKFGNNTKPASVLFDATTDTTTCTP